MSPRRIRLNLSRTHYLIYGSGCVNLFSASMNGNTVFMPAFTQAERIIELLMSLKNYKQFCRKFPCSLLALLANLTLYALKSMPNHLVTENLNRQSKFRKRAIHNSQFTIYHSQFTIYNSLPCRFEAKLR